MVPWAMRRPEGGRPGRWRLGCAVAASLMLHATGLWWWLVQPAPAVRVSAPLARQAMEVLWIMVEPTESATPASPLPVPIRGEGRSAQADAPRPGQAREARSVPPHAPDAPSEDTGQTVVALPAPLPAASDPREAPAVHWSPEGVARAARQESEWQRRHGAPAAAALAAGTGGSAPRPLGTLTEKEWNNAYTGRVTRVESAEGVYCVRLPSANRLPEIGAAPRIATVTNC